MKRKYKNKKFFGSCYLKDQRSNLYSQNIFPCLQIITTKLTVIGLILREIFNLENTALVAAVATVTVA